MLDLHLPRNIRVTSSNGYPAYPIHPSSCHTTPLSLTYLGLREHFPNIPEEYLQSLHF